MDGTSRRRFLQVGGALVGSSALPALARAQAADGPLKHEQDVWMDALPRGHRLAIDCALPFGAEEGTQFAQTYLSTSRTGYQVEPTAQAVVIILRHRATLFAMTHEMWAKYPYLVERSKYDDPETKVRARRNTLYGTVDKPGGVLAALVRSGVHFAVCGAALNFYANAIADETKANAADVLNDFRSHLIPNSHVVAAGIVGAQRLQEYGYSYVHGG